MVIKKEDLNTQIVKKIIEVLNSDVFKLEILGLVATILEKWEILLMINYQKISHFFLQNNYCK